jgi:hypothetical protein
MFLLGYISETKFYEHKTLNIHIDFSVEVLVFVSIYVLKCFVS